MKGELTRTKKTNHEQAERYEKLKKHSEALEGRLHDLKSVAASSQTEAKDLRAKIRLLDADRAQLTLKQGSEAGAAKKALHNLEEKKKELNEKDKRILELEKSVAVEKRKRETLETHFSELKASQDVISAQNKGVAQRLAKELEIAQKEAEEVRAAHVRATAQVIISRTMLRVPGGAKDPHSGKTVIS